MARQQSFWEGQACSILPHPYAPKKPEPVKEEAPEIDFRTAVPSRVVGTAMPGAPVEIAIPSAPTKRGKAQPESQLIESEAGENHQNENKNQASSSSTEPTRFAKGAVAPVVGEKFGRIFRVSREM